MVLDPGDTDRAWSYGHLSTPAQVEQLRREALRATDDILATVVDARRRGTMLVVAGMTPPTSAWELTPVVFHGAGVLPGHLQSESTKRPDLVTLSDISASALHALDVPVPDGMSGQPLEYREGDVSVARLQRANDVATGRERIYYPMSLTFIIVQAVFYLLDHRARAGAGHLPAALPVAPVHRAHLRRLAPRHLPGAVVALAHDARVGRPPPRVARGRRDRARGVPGARPPVAPLGVITAVTSLLLLVDVATGARLQVASILGYSPHTSARYFGFGNTAYAVLAATSLITAVLYVDRARNRTRPWSWPASSSGWSSSPTGAVARFRRRRHPQPRPGLRDHDGGAQRAPGLPHGRDRPRSTILVLCLAVGADLLRPEESRTHLANFVLDSRDGDTFWTTVSRKWSTNQRVFKQSAWTWGVPIIAIVAGYVWSRPAGGSSSSRWPRPCEPA